MKKHFYLQKTKMLFIAAFLISAVQNGWGQSISITTAGVALTEDFNTLASAGTSSTVPTGWAFLESGTGANTIYTAGNGSGNTGDTYSFGSTSSSERAFGGLQSGSINPTIGVSYTNSTGYSITQLSISYYGEQWRIGTLSRTDKINFQYSLDATSLSTGTWASVTSLDFIAPVTSGTIGALDGNASANRTLISYTIKNIYIANGSTFWIKFTDTNATGADDGLAIDDWSLTAYSPSLWTGTTSTDWNDASNWNTNAVPTSTDDIYISSTPVNQPQVTSDPTTPAQCYQLIIETGATLTINTAKALTVNANTINNGTVTLKSDATGTGSFIDNNSALLGIGTYHVEQYLTGSGGNSPNGRYWYVGAPVTTALSASFNAMGDNRLWSYSELTASYSEINVNGINLTPLQGFVARLGATETINFTGTFNTGIIGTTDNLSRTATGTYDGYNLVSNPYPSAINWGCENTPTTGLTMTNLGSTIWYRSNGGFATYNWSGDGTGQNSGQKYIPAMQGFWVRVTEGNSNGTLILTNSTRVHSSQSFYKQKSEQNIFRINVSNGSITDEAVIGFYNNAQNTFERFDSEKMFYTDDNAPQTYSLTSDNVVTAINGQQELTSGEERIVPIGFSTPVSGTFSFTATNLNDFDASVNVYLEDILQNVTIDLRQTNVYTFSSDAVNDANRFKIHFNGITTNISTQEVSSVYSYAYDNTLFVNTPSANSTIELYDVLGNLISEQKSISGLNKIKINNSKGIYIIKVLNGKDVFTQKVFIK
ncbi:MAG TPA: T9SS type A sorting domain-containing protein [Bacteroidales bacterium]|nr:T9SS type A sorting domain-containing protein [Bacteroidales bacterium]HPS18018.1 T9SS type A sorting domain-containing protein [Bacteroidales bacterium]